MSLLEYSEKIRYPNFNKEVHSCKRCPYFSTSIFFMINHVRTHRVPVQRFDCEKNSLEIYYCKDCDFQTNLTVNLKKHIIEYHIQSQTERKSLTRKTHFKRYFCAICNFETFFSLKWLQHVKTCTRRKKKILKKRSTKVKDKAKKGKLNQKTSSKCGKSQRHQCNQCEYKTNIKSHLTRHKIWKHLQDHEVTWYPCEKCSYKAKAKCTLKLHIQNRHLDEKDIKWHHCDQCPYKTKVCKDLKKHNIGKHTKPEEIMWFHCYHCSHITKFKDALKRHIEVIHGPNNLKPKLHKPSHDTKLYECQECFSIFNSAYTLKVHMMRKHSDEKDIKWFECDQCSYKAISASDIKIHKIYKHLTDDEINWFYCTFCSHKAKFKHQLARHVMRIHTSPALKLERSGGNKVKNFRCEKCPLRFSRRRFLERHIIDRHTDEKDIPWFQCDQCRYKSKRSHGLTEHKMRVHRPKTESVSVYCD